MTSVESEPVNATLESSAASGPASVEGSDVPMPTEDDMVEKGDTTEPDLGSGEKENASDLSALEDNITRKGKNAYYFAHAHKANGPKWDGKKEPKLLGRMPSSDVVGSSVKSSSTGFEYHKSNINSYAFSDEGNKVKLYVDLEGVGEKCPNDEDVTLDYTSTSFCLVVRNYSDDGGERCLSFGRLHGTIESASFRKKKDRIVVTLVKKKVEGGEEIAEGWPAVGARVCASDPDFDPESDYV